MLAGDNQALLISRQAARGFRHAFVTNLISNFNNTDIAGRFGSGYQFPLYLYSTADQQDLFKRYEPTECKPNLNSELVASLTAKYGKQPSPEDTLYYIYAVLYAPAYREKYADFLRMDFPRIPFTANFALFKETADLGERLTKLHLLDSPELDPPACRFEGQGDSRIEKGRKNGLRYDSEDERVYINSTQYFAPVPADVWNYKIGGYQVCEKWLKDRKERCLGLDEIRTYCRIVTALRLTIDLQHQIDELYPEIEKDLLSIPGLKK